MNVCMYVFMFRFALPVKSKKPQAKKASKILYFSRCWSSIRYNIFNSENLLKVNTYIHTFIHSLIMCDKMLPEDLHLAPHVLIQVWDNKVTQMRMRSFSPSSSSSFLFLLI